MMLAGDAGPERVTTRRKAEEREKQGRGQRCHQGGTAMRKLLYRSGAAIGLALLSPPALAATQEEVLTALGKVPMYALVAFAIVVAVAVIFMRSQDKRQTPLNRLYERSEAIHSVGPDTPVTECVRLMTAEKIGAISSWMADGYWASSRSGMR
jgi:hypothetical protein